MTLVICIDIYSDPIGCKQATLTCANWLDGATCEAEVTAIDFSPSQCEIYKDCQANTTTSKEEYVCLDIAYVALPPQPLPL